MIVYFDKNNNNETNKKIKIIFITNGDYIVAYDEVMSGLIKEETQQNKTNDETIKMRNVNAQTKYCDFLHQTVKIK